MKPDEWRAVRSDIQMIFQASVGIAKPAYDRRRDSSLNHCVLIIRKMSRQEVRERVKAMMPESRVIA